MTDDILIPDIDTIEGKLLKHAADLDYLILDEVVDRQKRLPIARIQFAPIDLMDFLDALDDGEDEDEEDEENDEENDEDEDEEEGDDEQERDEDISDQPTVERTRTQAAEATEATARTGLAEAAQQREGVDRHTQRMCSAVLLWIHGEVQRIIRNRPICTFRLRMYKPKGVHVASKNFKAENPSYSPPPADEPESKVAPVPPPPSAPTPPASQPEAGPAAAAPAPPPAPPAAPQPYTPQLPVLAPQQPLVVHAPPVQVILPAPAPAPPPPPVPLRNTPAVAIALGGDGHGQLVYLDPDTIPEARVWRALGNATEAFLGTVGRTYAGIIDLQARTVTHQATQLDKSQALVENLAGQLLVARQVQRTDETEQKVDERQLRVREELGKTFLSELGSLGRVLASSKLGVTPELVELGDIVSSSPELAEAVRDPSVRALLKDEKTTRELAQLLRLAAHKSNGGGNGTPPQAA